LPLYATYFMTEQLVILCGLLIHLIWLEIIYGEVRKTSYIRIIHTWKWMSWKENVETAVLPIHWRELHQVSVTSSPYVKCDTRRM
jgi:hypothetical protein